ncbi:MAG: hypothetical protein AB7O96_06905 [Pseudobdellovibrionaceae bacterium]
MEMNIAKVLLSCLALSAFATGCSKGAMKALSNPECPSPACTSEENSESLEPTPSQPSLPPIENVYKGLDMKANIKGGVYNNTMAVDLDKRNHALILYMPVGTNIFIGNVSATIPELPGASIKTTKLQNGSTVVAVSIPLKYIIKGIKFLDPARLPNGDPLPEIPAGELPGLAMKLGDKKDVNFYLYVGVGVVAVYVTSPFDPFIEMTFPLSNRDQTKVVGYFATVAEKEKESVKHQGGFFLSTVMPDEISRALDDYF